MLYICCFILSLLVVPCCALICHLFNLDEQDAVVLLIIPFFIALIIATFSICGMCQ